MFDLIYLNHVGIKFTIKIFMLFIVIIIDFYHDNIACRYADMLLFNGILFNMLTIFF